MTLVIKPGPIQRVDNYLYQLNTTPGLYLTNLWGGGLSPQNGNDPGYLANALKLMLAAEDMLAALKMIDTTVEEHLKGYTKEQFTHSMREWHNAVRDAIAKATN